MRTLSIYEISMVPAGDGQGEEGERAPGIAGGLLPDQGSHPGHSELQIQALDPAFEKA